MIETDVQMTADGRFVCHHDEFLPNGGCIWKLSLAEIRNNYTAEQLPLLEDILQLSFGKVYLNLEIKEYSSRDPKRVTEALTELVRSYGMHEYVLYSSFRIDYIRVLPWDALSIIIHPKDEYIAFFNSRSQHPVHLQKPSDEMLPSEMLKISNAIGYACMLDELTDERIQDITARNTKKQSR
jgi:glycerophosphoryl diester phosphodiesterase